MAASPPSTLQLGRPPRGAGGPSWSQAGKLVSTFRRGLSLVSLKVYPKYVFTAEIIQEHIFLGAAFIPLI